jgi:hypothetical protein
MAAAYALAGDAATSQATQPQAAAVAAAAAHGPALQQLLLRFLPFRGGSKTVGSATQQHQHQPQHNRHALLEELQRNPLWRFSSLDEQQRLQRNNLAKALPQQAHDALLDYVRMAADAEQQQQGNRQRGPRSAADAAADLHALYALAVVHVASQQQQPQHKDHANGQGSFNGGHHSRSLDDNEFLDLLKAYVSLDEAGGSSKQQQRGEQQQGNSGGQQHQATAAAVHALYAFAQLADSVQQKQKAPGELQAHKSVSEPAAGDGSPHAVHRSKQPGSAPGWCGDSSSSSSAESQHDLHVLLKLAQLSTQSQ